MKGACEDVADKTIGELTAAEELNNDSLLPIEQSGASYSITGLQLRDFAEEAAGQTVEEYLDENLQGMVSELVGRITGYDPAEGEVF